MLGNTLRRRHRGRSTTGAPTPCLPLSLSVVIREEETEKEKEAGRRKKKKEREEGTDSGPYFYKPPWNFMPSMGTLVWSDDPDVELKVVKPDMTYSSGRSVALRTPRLNAYSGRSLTTPSTSTIRRTLRCPVIVLPAATSSAPIAARLCQAPPRDRPLQLNHCSSQIQEPPRLRDRRRSSATRLRPSSTRTDELLRLHARRSLRPSYWEPDGTNIRAKLSIPSHLSSKEIPITRTTYSAGPTLVQRSETMNVCPCTTQEFKIVDSNQCNRFKTK
uniref:Uncharacterized protein n=1 Tax=Oryza rufipogon TaxID=4529 RepID=A0A0E0QCD9_ORYRU